MKQHTEIHSPALVAANTRKFKGTAYLVGGAVRDKLMGLEPKDQDYVVVGGDEESMLAAGFLPVGKDFPVFLHPDTREEYALARKERKTGAGYRGFSCEFGREITLEDDLFRRDLTINAMAMTAEGVLHDPYGGAKDLNEKVLRHVSEHFREDPVRILRIARFSARYGFGVAKDTMNFLKEMVTSGEFNSLQPERVWAELSKAHTEKEPGRFWQVLKIAGASEKLPGFYVDSQWPERSARILTNNHPQWHSHRLACSLQAVAIETIDLWKSDALTKERYGQWQYLLTLPPWHKASVDEKLAINKRLRAQQDPEKSSWLVYDVLITQGLKEEAEWARSAFLYDLTLLNNLDYASITMGLKGKEIKTMIEEAQKESLQIKNTDPTTKGLIKHSSLRKK